MGLLNLAALTFRWQIERDAVTLEGIAYKHNFLHESGRECDDFMSAMPWMDDGELHMGCVMFLTALHQRFMLVPFDDVVPGPHCNCGQCVQSAGSMPTAWERLAHRHACPDLAGLRTIVHDNMERLLCDFIRHAGMIDVHMEPRQ